jgi:serine protein kinase
MLEGSSLQHVHLSPLTINSVSIFAVLSRLVHPSSIGVSVLDKLHAYNDGIQKDSFNTEAEVANEGMEGISPRYVMNRISAVSSAEEVRCVTPIAAIESLWKGLDQNVNLQNKLESSQYSDLVVNTVKEYSELAIQTVQKAAVDSFENSANNLLNKYVESIANYLAKRNDHINERDMRDIERLCGITERDKEGFRKKVLQKTIDWKKVGKQFSYESDSILKQAIEKQLLPSPRQVARQISEPRFAKQKVKWEQFKQTTLSRLQESYGCCPTCSDDLINFVNHVLNTKKPIVKVSKNGAIEWNWPV